MASSNKTSPASLRAAVGALAVLFAAPFGYLILRTLADPTRFATVLSEPGPRGALLNTLGLAAAVALSATVAGTAAAWLTARTDLPGRRAAGILLPLPLVIPSFIGAFVLIAAFAPGGLAEALLHPLGFEARRIDGFVGSFIVLTLLTYPYVYLPVAVRLRQLPATLEESARLLGVRPAKTFFSVVLPQARGAVAAGTLLVFLYTISDFGVVQLMRYPSLTRAIYASRLLDPATSVSLSLVLGVLAVAIVTLERSLTRGTSVPAQRRGGRPLVLPLGRYMTAAAAFVYALVGLSLVIPVGVLVWWALRGLVHGGAGVLISDLSDLADPALNTSVVSTAAAVTAVAMILPAAYLVVRWRSKLGEVANAVIVAAFALPGLALALALVFWTLRSPGLIGALYQTLPLLVLAYVVHFGAHSMRAAQVAVASVPARVEEAARTLGAGRFKRLTVVELPLMLPGLLAGGGLVLLSAMKELPATLLLAPAGFATLATKIWTATESALFADAAFAALALVALSGVLTWLLVIRRSDLLV